MTSEPRLARARPLGVARFSPLRVELARIGLGPEDMEIAPRAIKVWDASPSHISEFEPAIEAVRGRLLRLPGEGGSAKALVLLPPDTDPARLPEPLRGAMARGSRAGGPARPLRCGKRPLAFERTHVMAIVNLTDDSFSSDGVGADTEAALWRAAAAVEDGATIVDIGGESARADVPIREKQAEIDLVVPAIERIAAEIDVIVSVDTWKPAVAEAAIAAGATLINDIGGLKHGRTMAEVAARHEVPLVLNHTWMPPKIRPRLAPVYDDVVDAVYAFLEDRISEATSAGLAEDLLIVDPGIAFGKSHDEDLEMMRRLGELRALGRPILLAHSRKHVIGSLLGGAPPSERIEGTVALAALAAAAGADIVRVHDVRAVARAVRVADALVRANLGDFAPTGESWPFPAR